MAHNVEDWEATCNYCLKEGTRNSVSACSACRLVRYCSKECQRKAWPAHKRGCKILSSDLRAYRAENPAADELNDRLSQWINFWRSTLFLMAPAALDLPNHGKDRLATHVFSLWLKEVPNSTKPAKYFRLFAGVVLTRELVSVNLRKDGTEEHHISTWEQDKRGSNTVQIFIQVGGCVRFLYFSYSEEELERQRGIAKDTARMLAEGCEDALTSTIESGQLPDLFKKSSSTTPRVER